VLLEFIIMPILPVQNEEKEEKLSMSFVLDWQSASIADPVFTLN
jgi:hypothetical protein